MTNYLFAMLPKAVNFGEMTGRACGAFAWGLGATYLNLKVFLLPRAHDLFHIGFMKAALYA